MWNREIISLPIYKIIGVVIMTKEDNLISPDHIRKYATCLVLDICHLRLIAENE